jgi:hypothetical protein
MSPTGREFMRQLGVALASLLATRCTTPEQTPTSTAIPLPVDPTRAAAEVTQQARGDAGEGVRGAWLALESLAAQTEEDSQRAETLKRRLTRDHRAALDGLVRSGALAEGAAGHVQVAFEEAAEHVWMVAVPVMCYKEVQLDYRPASREDLIARTEALAQTQDVDPETVALAQAAVAQDVAFLALSRDEARSLHAKIIEDTGSGTPIPPLEDVELEITPQAMEAAQFLVRALLGE